MIVEELKGLGFDRVYGSLFEAKSGIYTGHIIANLILGEEKAGLIRKVSQELGIDLRKSVAFGDTDQDENLLRMVGMPVAINPNRELIRICVSEGWRWFDREELKDLKKITEWLALTGRFLRVGSLQKRLRS